jgi:hypothetical protein
MSEPRIVFDANVVLSAALKAGSRPGLALEAAGIRSLTSECVLQEIATLFQRKKFDRYLPLKARLLYFAKYAAQCEIIPPTVSLQACRDPKDDKYLELAVSGRADCIVTGDADLLELHPFQGVAILTPPDFLAWLASRVSADSG